VKRFREKDATLRGSALINGGIYVLERAILDFVQQTPCSIETDIFPPLAANGDLAGFERDGYFLDIGLPETLETGRRELLARRAGLWCSWIGMASSIKTMIMFIEPIKLFG